MSYQVKIPVFEGPMDLLLHLIEKNDLDIYNIPIALITEQYLLYLQSAEEIDLELTSEFIVMACTLLSIKARMLLPRKAMELATGDEGDMDPRAELVSKILEYKEFKEKAVLFKEKEFQLSKVFWREIDEAALIKQFPPDNPVGELGLGDLFLAYQQMLRKIEKKHDVFEIAREEINLQEKMDQVILQLKENKNGLSFSQFFARSTSRKEIVVIFLALLELVRQKTIILQQSGLFAEIHIFLREGGPDVAHVVS